MTVFALPVAALAVCLLARRRSWRTALAEVGIVYGTVPWVWMTLLPGSGAGVAPARVSLVPLHDLLTMSADQIVGNLLIFAALGFFVPLRFAVLASVPRILALAAGCSILIEVSQYVFQLDRVSSVDDVLLNTAGAGLAALASRRWKLHRPAGGDRLLDGTDELGHEYAVIDTRPEVAAVDEPGREVLDHPDRRTDL
jgi:VanZ like protein